MEHQPDSSQSEAEHLPRKPRQPINCYSIVPVTSLRSPGASVAILYWFSGGRIAYFIHPPHCQALCCQCWKECIPNSQNLMALSDLGPLRYSCHGHASLWSLCSRFPMQFPPEIMSSPDFGCAGVIDLYEIPFPAPCPFSLLKYPSSFPFLYEEILNVKVRISFSSEMEHERILQFKVKADTILT